MKHPNQSGVSLKERMLQQWTQLVDKYNQYANSPSAKKWLELLWELLKIFISVVFRKFLDQF